MTPALRIALTCALLCGLATGCNGAAADGADAGAPPSELASLAIGVEIDGAPAPPIDAARVASTPADRVDGGRRVWRLRTLIGADRYPGRTATIAIETDGGARRSLVDEKEREGAREPMIAIDEAGAVRLALIRADEPFPSFDDPQALARVTRVLVDTRLALPADRPPAAAADLRVEVTVGGERVKPWTHADLDRVPRLPYTNDDAEGREAWSLRELARVLVGPDARVTTVEGEGRTVELDAARWRDGELLPVLRVTRRGLVKFQWLTSKLAHVEGDAGLRGVTGVRLASP